LGASQMQRLPDFIARRRELVAQYDELLSGLPVRVPYCEPNCESAWHLYVIRLDSERVEKSRQQVFSEMREHSIGVNVHYIPVHLQPYYRNLGFSIGDFPNAERYYAEAISLPLYFLLSDEDQRKVVDVLGRAVSE